MKKTLSMLTIAVLTAGLLGSCSKIYERIDALDKRVDGLENERIASIGKQIENINSSISDLGTIRQNIKDLTAVATAQGKDITDLQAADEALGERIDNLNKYVDDTLKAYATTEWMNASFSTLEQYKATCDTIAKIDARLGATSEQLSKDIKDCSDSLTRWVNTKFESYYTTAQMDAKVEELLAAIDTASEVSKAKADSIAKELTKAKVEIDTAKAVITREYTAAIATAITTSEGKLTKDLNDAIAKVNDDIEVLAGRVTDLEDEVAALWYRVSDLEAMIQSVTIIPAYDDGSVELVGDTVFIDCAIDPVSIVNDLNINDFSILFKQVRMTKAGAAIETLPADSIKSFKKDLQNGTVSIKANVAKYVKSIHYYNVAVNVKIRHSSTFTSSATTNYANIPLSPEVVLWENTENTPMEGWSNIYLFGPDGSQNCIATFDADTWAVIKNGVFRAEIGYSWDPTPNIRICDDSWLIPYGGYGPYGDEERVDENEYNCYNCLIDENWDGIGYIEIDMTNDAGSHSYDNVEIPRSSGNYFDGITLQGLLNDHILLFTGQDYTLRKLYCARH